MDRDNGPAEPGPMPCEARKITERLSISSYINAFYQIRDCMSYRPSKVLVVGVGAGLESLVMRERYGLDVTTMDIDAAFEPDHVGSVHDMSAFADQQFDVAIASHVLEHLPFCYFRQSLSELARVAKHAVIYLPYGGRHHELRFIFAERVIEYSLKLWLPPLRKWNVSGEKMELQGGFHYWECGYRRFSVRKITNTISEYFAVDRRYHNNDWKMSLNFLLTSKLMRGRQAGENLADAG